MSGPSVWMAILADPTVPFDRDTLALVLADQRRPSRRWLYPVVRPLSRVTVGLIRVVKRLLPVDFSAHSTMDRLCVRFLRRCVSPTAGALLLRLDIQTALCLMNIPFALCLTDDEYQRAVHSLRLDESLLAVLAELTGDPTFLRWRPGTPVVRVDSGLDVPRAVYEHAVICEYAHEYLRRISGSGRAA